MLKAGVKNVCAILFSRNKHDSFILLKKPSNYINFSYRMKKVVFTNGCFDIIHPGHIDLLNRAKALGTKLIVGINSDESVKKIKGFDRPILGQEARKTVLENLSPVDEVVIFEELTPEKIIESIKPDVLVKGGDWQIDEIIGAEFVKSRGGEVFSLPLKGSHSSTKIIEKINQLNTEKKEHSVKSENPASRSIEEHINVFQAILQNQISLIEEIAEHLYETFAAGNKILICGNGGSAADAQHLAAEFVGRFETERKALPAIALTTDTSALTALANDYDFERIFSRQVEALAQKGDCLIALSTSGNSPNVIAAVMKAREIGCSVVSLTGSKGKKLASLSDYSILVPSERTARIQEAHITIAHIWCEMIDKKLKQ